MHLSSSSLLSALFAASIQTTTLIRAVTPPKIQTAFIRTSHPGFLKSAMGFIPWSWRKSRQASKTDAPPPFSIPDPAEETEASQRPEGNEGIEQQHLEGQISRMLTRMAIADEFSLSMPGAFPSSPPLSPRLPPLEREEPAPVSSLEPMDADVPPSLELPTELGSYLRPRRPQRVMPAPKRTKLAPTLPRTPVRQAALQDEMVIDDPWSRKSLIYEKLPFGRPVSAVSLFSPKPKQIPPNRIASIYASEWERRERERAARERDLYRPARTVPQGPPVRPLTWQWLDKVSAAMGQSQGIAVAKSISGDNLYQRDIATCFTPLAWLNDEIINSYLTAIVHYLRQSTGNMNEAPRYHAFNSFFYSSLRDKGYQAVRRWANRAKIGGEALLNVDTVFVPVHEHAHWTLMVVRPIDRTIEYFDSLGGAGAKQVRAIKEWLRGELGAKFDEDEWTVLPSKSSHQDNGSDCGVFLLTNAKAIALGIEPTAFGPRDTNLLRRKIVAELMNGGLHGEFNPIDRKGQLLL